MCQVTGVLWSHRADCIVKTILGNTMSRKKLIMFGMVVGSIAGGYAPSLFGVDGLMTSLLGSTAGGILGMLIAYRLS
jgi:ABC-type lipoprotein release transport system permease subunit